MIYCVRIHKTVLEYYSYSYLFSENKSIINFKLSDVTGSMENLMDETHEKLSSLFGKVGQKTEDAENAVEDVVNDSTSAMPE